MKNKLFRRIITGLLLSSLVLSTAGCGDKKDDATKYSTVGSILEVLLSKWGFFGIIIVPFFIMFMIELFARYPEIRYGKKKNN